MNWKQRRVYEPKLGEATTAELLDELSARNEIGQKPAFKNTEVETERLIVKLRKAFVVRIHGLDYRTVDGV